MEQRPKSVANDVDVQQVDAETVFGEVVEYAFCLLLQRNVLDDYEIASAESHGGQAQAVADGANSVNPKCTRLVFFDSAIEGRSQILCRVDECQRSTAIAFTLWVMRCDSGGICI